MPEQTPQIHLSIPRGRASAPSSPTSPPPQRYKPIKRSEPDVRMEALSPHQLEALLSPAGGDVPPPHQILVVDVRPWNMYVYTHIASSISICIPSTLIKRPTFGFERMLEFVSPQDVPRLRAHCSASHIVFYDQGTTHNPADSNLRRTAAKFLSATPSPQGKLYWLRGGLLAVSREVPALIEAGDDLMEMASDECDEEVDGEAHNDEAHNDEAHNAEAHNAEAHNAEAHSEVHNDDNMSVDNMSVDGEHNEAQQEAQEAPETSTNAPNSTKETKTPGTVHTQNAPKTHHLSPFGVPGGIPGKLGLNLPSSAAGSGQGERSRASHSKPHRADLKPKLTLSSMRAEPRSPFSLVAERHSPLPPVGPPTPSLDQSSHIVLDDEIGRKFDDLPKWLKKALDLTKNGQNVLAEGFQRLESLERHRSLRAKHASDPSPSVMRLSPALPSTPHVEAPFMLGSATPSPSDNKKEYSHKQRQQVYLHQREKEHQREHQREKEQEREREKQKLMQSQDLQRERSVPRSNPSRSVPPSPRGSISTPPRRVHRGPNRSNPSLERPSDFSLVRGNDPRKNRYTNIAPYSYNAVRVKNNREFFNGSFISSTLSPFRYIATQAPTPSAFGDFWTCVWEQKVPLIVMLTTLVTESGQIKGNKYWFDSKYDALQVEQLSETQLKLEEAGNTTLREIRLTDTNTGEQRVVCQLQYLDWPDLGTPSQPSEVLRLVSLKRKIMADARMPEDSHVIVHCSAGCGRTGTFCTIDTVTDYLERNPADGMNTDQDIVFEVASQFRDQRLAMVQNQRQLQLCYQATLLWCSLRLETR